MEGFGVHTSMWTMHWDRAGAERTIPAAAAYKMDFIEIALLNTAIVDVAHTRALLDKHGMRAICSLGLPQENWASVNPDGAIDHLKDAIDTTARMGGEALSGVTFGGIGQRTGVPPTEAEYDNIARVLEAAAKHARAAGVAFGIEPVNRYENHILNTAQQAVDMIEKVGGSNLFVHLDTYHMNIEEKDLPKAILNAGSKLGHLHACGSDRGTPGGDHTDWEGIRSALKEINYTGGISIESFTPDVKVIAKAASIWRSFEPSKEDIAIKGLQFLRSYIGNY